MGSNVALGVTIGAVLGATFHSTFGSADTRVRKLGDALASATRRDKAAAGLEQAKSTLAALETQLAASAKGLGALHQKLDAGPPTRKLARDVSAASKAHDKLHASVEQARGRVKAAEAAHESAARAADKHRSALGRLGRSLVDVERKHAQMTERIKRRDEAAARFGAMKGRMLGMLGALFAGKRGLDQATTFDSAVVRLSTVINAEDVGQALVESRRTAMAFARRNLASETDILGIEYALNSAGFQAGLARAGAGVVTKVATVTNGAAESVGEIMATVYNNLGGSLTGSAEERFKRIGELLTRTQFKFQIRDFNQLGESMKYATTTMSQYQVELDQGVTLVGALNSAGLQGSMAGTAMAASFRQLSKASKAFGFQVARNEQGGVDFIATLERLSDKIGGFDNISQETNDQLQKAFGDEGLRAVILLGKQLQTLRAAQQDVRESSRGVVDESYQRFVASAAGQQKIFANNVRLIGTAFAGSLLPAVNAVLAPLTGVARWVGSAIERYPALSRVIGGVAAGLMTVTAGAAAWAGAVWLFNTALLASPIGWIIGGLAAVGVAAYALYQNWDHIAAWLGGVWNATWDGIVTHVGGAIHRVVGWIRQGGEWLKGAFLRWHPLGILISHWDEIAGYLATVPGRMYEAGASIVGGMIDGIKSAGGALKDSVVGLGDGAVGWFKEKLGIHSPSRVFAGLGRHVTEGLALGVSQGAGGPLGAMDRIVRGLAAPIAAGALALGGGEAGATAAPAQVIHINITVNGPADADVIADRVREVMEEQGRRGALARNARAFD